jgi:hypothetical protein
MSSVGFYYKSKKSFIESEGFFIPIKAKLHLDNKAGVDF